MHDPLAPYTLASRSPRRRAILAAAGFVFDVVDSTLEELLDDSVPPAQLAQRLALAKARAAVAFVACGTVIAGDTIVECRGRQLGKPRDREHAVAILRELSGSRHQVISAVALLHRDSGFCEVGVDATSVTMKPMSAAEIQAYVDSGEADGKAGAYAIQETGDRFVIALEGEYDTVVGFPLRLFRRLHAQLTRRVTSGGPCSAI
ncbi:MAG: Maf family protein [Planctomycetota bacterium]